MKKLIPTFFLLIAAGVLAANDVPQTCCPVLGKPIDKAIYVDMNGYRMYACSSNCLRRIKTDARIMYLRMKDDGIDVERSPKQPDGISGASKKKKRCNPLRRSG